MRTVRKTSVTENVSRRTRIAENMRRRRLDEDDIMHSLEKRINNTYRRLNELEDYIRHIATEGCTKNSINVLWSTFELAKDNFDLVVDIINKQF